MPSVVGYPLVIMGVAAIAVLETKPQDISTVCVVGRMASHED